MPTVATEGPIQFVIYANENAFEAPYVHVKIGHVSTCRIELVAGTFMDDPPGGMRRQVLDAYSKHAFTVAEAWDRIHTGK